MRNVLLLISFVLIGICSTGQISSGKIDTVAHLLTAKGHQQNFYVWTSGSYDSTKPCQVIYVFDGHMLFDAKSTWNNLEWTIDETIDELMTQQLTGPTIVVGLGFAESLRHSQYTPEKPFFSMMETQQKMAFGAKRSNGNAYYLKEEVCSDDYLQWLVNVVKPYVDSNYSTQPDPTHTYLGGASMGGLMAFYGLLEFPEVFNRAFCLSTNWPLTDEAQDPGFLDAWNAYCSKRLSMLPNHFVYMDHGDQGKDATYGAYQKKVDSNLRQNGFNHFETLEFPSHDHSETSWAKRLREVLIRVFLH